MRSIFVTAALVASAIAAPLAQEDTSQLSGSTVVATMDPTIAAATEAFVDPIRTDTVSSELAAPTGLSNSTMTPSSSSSLFVQPTMAEPTMAEPTMAEPTVASPPVTGGEPTIPTAVTDVAPKATHAWHEDSWKGWWGHRKGRRPELGDANRPTQYSAIDSNKSTLEAPAPTTIEATDAAIPTAVDSTAAVETTAEDPTTRPTLTMTATTTMLGSSGAGDPKATGAQLADVTQSTGIESSSSALPTTRSATA